MPCSCPSSSSPSGVGTGSPPGEGPAWPGGWGPVALGIACSIKQTPWFCIPFLVIGVALVAHRSGRNPWPPAARYLGIVVGIFVLVNLPFIIWSPVAWWNGMLLPFSPIHWWPTVRASSRSRLHGLTGGVRLSLLSLAGAFVYLALLFAFVLWFPVLKRSWLFLLPVVLFVPPRSLSSYLIDFFPVAIVGALTVAAPAAAPRAVPSPARRWRAGLAIHPLAVAAAVGAVAFTSAPLDLTVAGFRTSNATQELDSVTVLIHEIPPTTQ